MMTVTNATIADIVKSFRILVDPHSPNCSFDPSDRFVGSFHFDATRLVANNIASPISLCLAELDRNKFSISAPSKGTVLCSQQNTACLWYFIDCGNYGPCVTAICRDREHSSERSARLRGQRPGLG